MRNQLVWLDPAAWAQIELREWDEQAQAILAHWRTQRLPLVVCRQRPQTSKDQVCVGLPAPQQWSRRRLALNLDLNGLAARDHFPTLLQVAQANQWGRAARSLSDSLSDLGLQARVYGSHGWQWLTGLTYVHDASDLDLSVSVHSLAQATAVVKRLARTSFHCRIDGEIVFPQGQAIAWRELRELLLGNTVQVLVKDSHTLRLATLPDVIRMGYSTPEFQPDMVLTCS